ncbi:MAG TPA: DNA polymerase IV [Thermoleophilaceae bacterium]|nr:DNA polymerase IV [Thermoleophilaceae bacterium]
MIAHVDMDAFYVSVELQRRPDLAGRPVVVAGSGPRAVVTTASYEARKFGVFSATPASRARRLCADAVFLPPDFKLYRERSRDVMAVLRENVEIVEVVGLDEAYLDLRGFERPKAAARRVKAAVEERTGLGCSIGMGPSKLVAKVASDAEKPNGFVVLSREAARDRFASAAPGLIPGIGPKTAARLAEHGIDTLAKLGAALEAELTGLFGPRLGVHLGRLARFEHDSPVTPVRVAKSESRETTFDQDLSGLETLTPVLERLSAELCTTLEREDRRGPTIGIKVRLDDFSTHTRARTLDAPTNDRAVVTGVASDLLREFDPPRPVRLLGVRVAGLDRAAAEAATGPGDDQMALAV